jgi:hypothetical protein
MFRKIKPKDRLILKAVVCCLYRYRTISEKVDALISWSVKLHRSWIGLPVASSVRMDCQCCLCNLVAFPTRIGLPILSVILELPLSVRGVGRRTQPISKLLNDLLITSALNPTCLVQSALNPTCLLQVSDISTHLYLGSGPL